MYFNIIGKATDIEYDVNAEDVDVVEEATDEELHAAIEKYHKEVEKEHGKEMTFYLTMDEDDLEAFEVDDPEDIDFEDPEVQDFLDQLVGDYISDETGFCIDGFNIDFDSCHIEAPTYQVVVFGYDKKHNYVDDILINKFLDKDKAIEVAKSIEKVDDAFLMRRRKNKIAYVNIEVETVLKDGEDSEVNMDTIWTTSIEVA